MRDRGRCGCGPQGRAATGGGRSLRIHAPPQVRLPPWPDERRAHKASSPLGRGRRGRAQVRVSWLDAVVGRGGLEEPQATCNMKLTERRLSLRLVARAIQGGLRRLQH